LKHQWAERADADRFHCHLNYKGCSSSRARCWRARAAGIDAFSTSRHASANGPM
jgi:hypothetical protein